MAWVPIALALLLGAARQEVGEFRIEPLPKDGRELEQRFTAAQIDLLEKLNRRDREHLPRAEPRVPGLVVPVTWPDDELLLSPFPSDYVWARMLPKVVIVDQRIQAFAAYEFGRLVRWPVRSVANSQRRR